jgi:predicted permease
MARARPAAMPVTLGAFFMPVLCFMLVVYLAMRRFAPTAGAATPSVRAISATFGNTVQLGIPLATALFGEAGLSVHLAIVSLHALTLLTLVTALVELDLARDHARSRGVAQPLAATLLATVRNTVIHPVVLPVLAGLVFNLGGWTLPALADETLLLLALAVVALGLVVIHVAILRHQGLCGRLAGGGQARRLPALVLAVPLGRGLPARRWR